MHLFILNYWNKAIASTGNDVKIIFFKEKVHRGLHLYSTYQYWNALSNSDG